MKIKLSTMRTLKIFFLFYGLSHLFAQPALWVNNVIYESPLFVAPAVVVIIPSTEHDMTFGVIGWTISSALTEKYNPALSAVYSAEFTPIHGNGSNYIYRNGKIDDALSYDNMTLQLKGGLEIKHTDYWSSQWSLLALYELVDNLHNKSVSDFWESPFYGIEIQQNYTKTASNDIFQSRSDGLKLNTKFQIFTGLKTWLRSITMLAYGKKFNGLFLQGNGSLLLGNSLNQVSRFLIGGSWDLPGINTLYGYHYAEFRLDNALLLNTAIDIKLTGNWELGLRASYLNSSAKSTYGAAVKFMTVWHGIAFNAGIGFPKTSLVAGNFDKMIAFSGLTVAFF